MFPVLLGNLHIIKKNSIELFIGYKITESFQETYNGMLLLSINLILYQVTITSNVIVK